MKTNIILAALLFTTTVFAQTKKTIAVLNVDSKGLIHDPETMGYMVRLELEKTAVYTVMDKYEVADAIKKNNLDISNCYSKSCLVDAGKKLGVDKMMSGSIERFGEKIVVTLRIIDMKTESIEKTETTEYLNLQPEVQKMIEISVKKILGIAPDEQMVSQLINYDTPIESPKNGLRLNGPRMGASYTFGMAGERLKAGEQNGGFNMYPVTSQFGWQKEFQYISAGNFQALIENVFMIGGLESAKFIPSYTFLNGFRVGKAGWEFAFGPTFRLVKKANGFFDDQGLIGKQGDWHLERDWYNNAPVDTSGSMMNNPYQIVSQLDSRGQLKLSTGLLIGIGRTFHSGYLNIPVNFYVSPRKEGTIVGASFGFNIQKKKKIE